MKRNNYVGKDLIGSIVIKGTEWKVYTADWLETYKSMGRVTMTNKVIYLAEELFTDDLYLIMEEGNNQLNFIVQVLKHEIVHAFLIECGLWHNTHSENNWAVSEEMTDFFAYHLEELGKLATDARKLISKYLTSITHYENKSK